MKTYRLRVSTYAPLSSMLPTISIEELSGNLDGLVDLQNRHTSNVESVEVRVASPQQWIPML